MSRKIVSSVSGFGFEEFYEGARFFIVVSISPDNRIEAHIWRATNVEIVRPDFEQKNPGLRLICAVDIYKALETFAFIHEVEYNLSQK